MSHPAPENPFLTLPGNPPEVRFLAEQIRARWNRGLLFQRFRLERELGFGGMAVVWLALDERLRRPVALKFLAGAVLGNPDGLDDLRAEINRCLDLNHPSIIRVHDLHLDEEAGLAAIAMEYVAGRTLAAEKSRQPGRCFEVAEPLLGWVRTLCQVLEYVHEEAKTVHRDLKPGNLMLTVEGKLRVTDFGIAAALTESQSMSLTGQYASTGTVVYMSPQQLRGKRPRAEDDLYALGATVYELLTSRPPFFRGGQSAIMEQVRTEAAPSMQERREELDLTDRRPIPSAWEKTIAACLAKEPGDRPGGAREVAARLGLYPSAGEVKAGGKGREEPVAPGNGPASLPADDLSFGQTIRDFRPAPLARPGSPPSGGPALPRPNAWPAAPPAPVAAAPAAKPRPAAPAGVPAQAAQQPAFENTLGMKFMPVPIVGGPLTGQHLLFSVWVTRVRDYGLFARETASDLPRPDFDQGPTHPVVRVSWEEAAAFCEWLSRKEGRLYRLPGDHEWSCAVGMGDRENAAQTPEVKSGTVPGYPWGQSFPPPRDFGNYDPSLGVDRYRHTSPVGSFRANRFGLFDMSGNVWQWCDDQWNGNSEFRVLRGGSWLNGAEISLRSSFRNFVHPSNRNDSIGFRCVLVPSRSPDRTVYY